MLGPQVDGPAVRWGPLTGPDELPQGIGAETSPGHYRLKQRSGPERFAWGPSPDSLKRWLHVPEECFVHAAQDNGAFHILPGEQPGAPPGGAAPPKFAFIGMRPCDLAALVRLDAVFLKGPYVEEHYSARRREAFLVVVNCTASLDTCFCASMECGPGARTGYDVALTEHTAEEPAAYLAEAGSARGVALIEAITAPRAEPGFIAECREACKQAAAVQRRRVDWRTAPAVMLRSFEHPRWEQTARRCLACGNCTLTCPTCFCVNTIEHTAIDGSTGGRSRVWDSCFTQNFTYIHGGSVRTSVKSRYRQWLGHKLAWWQQQFGTAGCTGCGRCIAWCPAGIDISEEFAALAGTAQGGTGA